MSIHVVYTPVRIVIISNEMELDSLKKAWLKYLNLYGPLSHMQVDSNYNHLWKIYK